MRASCYQELDIRVTLFACDERRELAEFREREMRAAQHHHVQLGAGRGGQLTACVAELLHGDDVLFKRRAALKGRFERGSFGRNADDVKQRYRA